MLRPRVAKSSDFSKQIEIHILCETYPLQLFAANCTVFFKLDQTKYIYEPDAACYIANW